MVRIVRMMCLVYIHTVICSSSWWSGGVIGGLLFETCLTYAVMLGGRRPFAAVPFLFAPSAPLQSPQIKKITHHRDSAPRLAPQQLPHASCQPSSPPSPAPAPAPPRRAPHGHTITACSPHETAPPDCYCRLHRVRPIVGGAHSLLPVAAILLLHRDRTTEIPLCHAPLAWRPCFAESACCKRMF